jgi:hypothetical protein
MRGFSNSLCPSLCRCRKRCARRSSPPDSPKCRWATVLQREAPAAASPRLTLSDTLQSYRRAPAGARHRPGPIERLRLSPTTQLWSMTGL